MKNYESNKRNLPWDNPSVISNRTQCRSITVWFKLPLNNSVIDSVLAAKL